MHTRQNRLPGEFTFMVLIVLFSTFMLWAAYGISKFDSVSSAGAFPMVCTLTMLVTGLMSFVKTAKTKVVLEGNETLAQQMVRKVLPTQLVWFTTCILIYMFALEWLGFLIASYVFLAVSMSLLGSKRIGLNLLVSLGVLAAIYVVFQTVFSVVLPAGSLIGPFLPEFLK
jgi:putative tricarboxylic transport membrane protein